MNTRFDLPPAGNTRSRFDSPPASNTRSRTIGYPVPKPELNNGRTRTPQHEAAATPLLRGRSVLPSQQVSKKQLMTLILNDGLSNDISYEVHDSCVQISNCPNLKCLSGNISFMGTLLITECPELRSISANLFVGGCLFIHTCPLLEKITGSVTVNQSLSADEMTSLVDLPGTFSIGGSLLVCYCPHLMDLSGHFSVRQNANFKFCKRLIDVSGKFIVGDALDLSYCHHLANMSGNFSVAKAVDLNHCTRLKVVPDWITTLGSRNSGNLLTVDLQFTGLSDADIGQLRAAKIPGVCFITTSEKTRRPHKIFDNLPEALGFWWDLACANMDTPQLNLQPEQTEDMLDFLEQLTWSSENWDKNYQPVLAQRVVQAITLILMDDRLREEALIHISKGTIYSDEVVSSCLEPLEDMLEDNKFQSLEDYLHEHACSSESQDEDSSSDEFE